MFKSRKKRSMWTNSVPGHCTKHLQRESVNLTKNSVYIKAYQLVQLCKTTRKILTQPCKSIPLLLLRNMIAVRVRKSETRK